VDVQDRLAVFTRSQDTYPDDFVGAIHRKQHGVRRCFVRTSGANHDLPFSDSAYKDRVTHGYALVCRETFNALRNPIAILKPYNENPADAPFTCLHAQSPPEQNS
jgi:hypothetical protein